VQRAEDTIRVPAAALRFRPTAEMFELLKQPVPPEAQQNQGRGGAGGGRRGADASGAQVPAGAGAAGAQGATGAARATGAPGAADSKAAVPAMGGNRQRGGDQAAGGGQTGGNQGGNRQRGGDQTAGGGNGQGGRGGGGRGGFQMTPEQQKKMDALRANTSLTPEQRRAEMAKIFGGNTPFGGGRGGNNGGRNGGRNGGQNAAPSTVPNGVSTIDQLLPPVVKREQRNQRVWIMVSGQLKPINGLTTGVSDGQFTQLVSGDLKEGDKVVTNFVIPGAKPAAPGQQQGNPFQQGQPGGGRGPGGGGGGRGGF
jgi:hypothetical protein